MEPVGGAAATHYRRDPRPVRLDGFLRHDEGGRHLRAELAAAEGKRAKQEQAHSDAWSKYFNPKSDWIRRSYPWTPSTTSRTISTRPSSKFGPGVW